MPEEEALAAFLFFIHKFCAAGTRIIIGSSKEAAFIYEEVRRDFD
jgi:hypothetical protein